MELLKVAAHSNPKAVAGALSAIVEKEKEVELHAVGAGAVNQAVKAIAIARGFVAPKGMNLVATIAFSKIEIAGEEKTAIKFHVLVQPS